MIRGIHTIPLLRHALKTLVPLTVQLLFVARNTRYVIVFDVMLVLRCCEDCSGVSVMYKM
jgi:hypothetical protein